MATISQDQIYLDYKEKVTRFVTKKVGDRERVDDLVSDIFLKIYEHLDSYDKSKSALSTWIYTISSNTVLDYYRTRKISLELPEDSGETGMVPDALVENCALDSRLILDETLTELALALEKLPERERDLIILHYYKGEKLKDIADMMRMSYANAKVIHKKALGKLKNTLSQSGRPD